jgi:hypothetical protein
MFSAIGADGTGLVSLGVGNDFAWMPRSAIEAVESEPITPSAAPSVEASPTAATAADFVVPFTYTIPAGERVFVDQVSKTQPEEIVRIAGGQSHAIDVLLVTYLHPCPASVPVPTPGPDGGVGRPTVPLNRDPEQFLAYLRDEAGVGITDIREATLGGYPALAADIDPAAATCSGAKLHSNGLGIGGIGVERVLDGPGRLVVARVNSYQAVVAHIWADEELYADWLPTATQIVDSIEFTPSNP